MKSRPRLHLAAFLAFALLTGCVTDDQLTQVRSFATAATAFSTQANDAFGQFNDSFVDRNLSKVAMGEKKLEDKDFVGVLDDSQGYKDTQKAIKVLGAYASSLNDLASASYTQGIDKAATDLYGALHDLDKDAVGLSAGAPQIKDADLGLLATAVKGLGEAVVEEKRLKAITQAVTAADDSVQAICKGLKAVIDGSKSTYRKNLDEVYSAKFSSYGRESGPLSYADRMTRLGQLRTADQAMKNADDFLTKLSAAAQALGEAHAKIKKSLTDPKSSLADVVRSVGQLQSFANELKTFNASLQKK